MPLHIIAPAVYHGYLQQLLSTLDQTSPFYYAQSNTEAENIQKIQKTATGFSFFSFSVGHI